MSVLQHPAACQGDFMNLVLADCDGYCTLYCVILGNSAGRLNWTPGFGGSTSLRQSCFLCQGRYPAELLQKWHEWDELHGELDEYNSPLVCHLLPTVFHETCQARACKQFC